MADGSEALINLDGVTKVFYTDEVETHALAGVHLEIRSGEFVSIAGPSGCGKSTLLSILRAARFAERRQLLDQQTSRSQSLARRSHAHPQSRNRIYLPGLQSHRRFNGLRKRRIAAYLSQHAFSRSQKASAGSARTRRHGAPHEALPLATLGRSTTARSSSPRTRRPTVDPAGGRTHRKLGLEKQRSGDGTSAATAPRRRHHLHGDARPALRQHRRSRHSSLRRPHRRRHSRDARRKRLTNFKKTARATRNEPQKKRTREARAEAKSVFEFSAHSKISEESNGFVAVGFSPASSPQAKKSLNPSSTKKLGRSNCKS